MHLEPPAQYGSMIQANTWTMLQCKVNPIWNSQRRGGSPVGINFWEGMNMNFERTFSELVHGIDAAHRGGHKRDLFSDYRTIDIEELLDGLALPEM
jgi:hypothetical protein